MTDREFDPIALLDILNRHGVRYVVIGGFAAVAYGSPLPTSDIDITPDPELGNLARLSGALGEMDARLRVDGIPDGLPFAHNAQSLRDVSVLNLVTRLGELDLVVRPAGDADYSQMASRQLMIRVHDTELPLAALDDVIASKEAAGRAKDRTALPILRELQRRLHEM